MVHKEVDFLFYLKCRVKTVGRIGTNIYVPKSKYSDFKTSLTLETKQQTCLSLGMTFQSACLPLHLSSLPLTLITLTLNPPSPGFL